MICGMDLFTFLINILAFINEVFIPFLLAVAFIIFIWNAGRYFVIQAGSEDARTKAKRLALWGVLAFVIIFSIWGIVNLIVNGLNLEDDFPVTPDYVEERRI